ncbi:MAG TPA: DUF4350 domain-containing protein [Candidatus Methanofastidiosa archaeon]|nr:DUF4350 domain-containing protein [Candidatus Methanofastidiosa archaeon]
MFSPGMKKFYVYLLIFIIVIVFIFVPLVVPYLSRSSDFSVFNNGWNGTSGFYRDYMENVSAIDLEMNEERYLNAFFGDLSETLEGDYNDSVVVIIGPRASYSGDEKAFLRQFVEGGGTLLIADDFGTGNEVLEGIGLEARFSNLPMLDTVFEKAGAFPIAYKGGELSEYSLLLNYPSTIEGDVIPIFETTSMAFLDIDEDGSYGKGDISGPFTVVASVEIGDGIVYMISDPSILINNMIGKMDNMAFLHHMMEDITDNYSKTVYIDEAHLGTLEDIERFNVVLTMPNNPLFRYIIISFLLIVLVIEGNLLSYVGSVSRHIINKFKFGKETSLRSTDRKELIDSLKKMHPEWQASGLNSFFSKFR